MDLLTANDKQGKYPASYYAEHATQLEKFPCLKNEIQADVCVVGGGFTGLSTALHLAQSGYKVALLEAKDALLEAKDARLEAELEEQKKISMMLRQEIDQLRRRE